MVNRRSISLGSAAVLVGCAILIIWQAGLPASPDFVVAIPKDAMIAVPVKGGLVPSFEVQTLHDERLIISPDLNHPLIINFWATWCAPCVEEMPVLERLFQLGIPVVGINVGLEDTTIVSNWVAQVGLTFPIVVDDRTREAQYRITALPTTFFVDADGVIQKVERGALTEKTLAEGLVAIGMAE